MISFLSYVYQSSNNKYSGITYKGIPPFASSEKDPIDDHGHHDHKSYYGDRDTDSLVKMMEDLTETIKLESQMNTSDNSSTKLATGLKKSALVIGGCRIECFVHVKKVPGNLIISARSAAHSFVASQMNMSYVISSFLFESSVECNASTSCNPKGKISLIGVRRQNNKRIWEASTIALDASALSMEGDIDMLGPSILNLESLGVDDVKGTYEELLC
ncbi:Protein disulfide-isomerase 5-4 [Capsicum baccatum]|uniref:Protein disulfide-isomerase 5-4 n=1 Tax=Capsicum baccatum TaxID=33114 RepID=A0A2G2WHN0_CAPBA|nr:Protein disulfide-isomerase 5-4 [Capsicum baccatum]